MAALVTTNPTLKDIAAVTGADGQIQTVVELLTQSNGMLEDMTWQEGNLPTGHRSTVRTGIPPVTWRSYYGGIQPGKSTNTTVTDNCGMLEALAEVDKALADLNGNSAAFRLQEDMAQLQSMNNEIQRVLIYGNEGAQPAAFGGFMPRFNSLSAANSENVIAGGGVGTDNASVLLVYWSPMTAFGIIPKGSTAGLQRKDFGEVMIENVDGNGGRMLAYRTHYRFDAGLCVKDWRAVVRVCNIDKSLLSADGSTGAKLPDLLFQALEVVPDAAAVGRPVFYMPRVVITALRQQLSSRTGTSTLTIDDVGGKKVYSFQGVPLRRIDAMAADEALVS